MFKPRKSPKNLILMLLPAAGLMLVVFGGGLFFAAAESLGFFSSFGKGDLTTENYVRLWRDAEVRAAISYTLFVTFVSTLLAAAGGTILAVRLKNSLRNSATLKVILQIPLAVPHLAVALVLLGMLAPSGIFARFFYHFGLIGEPSGFPVLIADNYGIGIIAAYFLKETPFIALLILTVLARAGDEYESVAQNLGASRRQRFRFVTLPLITPPLIFSSLIVWVFIFGAFEVPLILGRIYPAMLAVVARREFAATDLQERPEAMALAVLMTLLTTLFVWLYLRWTKNFLDFEKTSVF